MVKVLACELIHREEGQQGPLFLDLFRVCAIVDLNDELIAHYGYEREVWYQDALREVSSWNENRTVQSADSALLANDEAAGSP